MLSTSAIETSSVQGTALHGKVFGGQQPIVGANVYLYEAGISGYGAAATSLLTSPVNTGSDGSFSISNDYTCPSASTLVYLYTLGGDPSPGIPNSGAGLLAALGACGTLSSSTFVQVNEVSTIATAYAIAAYATDATDVSSPNTTRALTGIANAFAAVPNLETLGTGVALATTPAGNGTVPQSKINTLANILAACINSTGPSSSACSTLFSNAKNGSTAPTDTATAAINIAHNPGANVTALYGLQPATGAPFQPTRSTEPNDFTIAIVYTGGGLNWPAGLGIDLTGNVWTANYQNDSIGEFSPVGAAISHSSGFTGGGLNYPYGLAIDATGNVWAVDNGNSYISEFSSGGSPVSSTGYTGGGLTAPWWIAIDKSGNVWATNTASISEFSSAGVANANSPIITGGVSGPQGVAIDTSGNVWVANKTTSTLSEYSSLGVANASSPFTGGGLHGPFGVAVDAAGNIWVSNYGNDSLSEFNFNGTPNSNSPFTGGGMHEPAGVAIDGSGNIWMANYGAGSLSEFNSSGTAISGSNGYALGDMSGPDWVAIDGSGNAWVADRGDIALTEIVGIATPVVTPMVANLLPPYGSQAVNKP
jgi:streptogramin lyase